MKIMKKMLTSLVFMIFISTCYGKDLEIQEEDRFQSLNGVEYLLVVDRVLESPETCFPRNELSEELYRTVINGDHYNVIISNNGQSESIKMALLLPDSHHVKERLCGVGVHTVSGIDYGCIDQPGQEVGGPGCAVADDDSIRVHGLKVFGCVSERFALGDTAGRG